MKWLLLIVWLQAGDIHTVDYRFRYAPQCSKSAESFKVQAREVMNKQFLVVGCFPVSSTGA